LLESVFVQPTRIIAEVEMPAPGPFSRILFLDDDSTGE
jgi:hypothetical protein